MQKVLITGHSGMLGQALVRTLERSGNFQLFGISKSKSIPSNRIQQHQLDLADAPEVEKVLAKIKPDIIIHTAAFTNLAYCEANQHATYVLHVELTKQLAGTPAKMIYISTDSVFEGQDGSYAENDPTYPLNYYAQSKLQGEWAALGVNPNTLALRVNIYGFKKPGGNSLAEWALESFKQNKTISGYTDVLFNPLYVGQVAEIVTSSLQKDVRGVLHVGASDFISKFDFLKALAKTFGYSDSLVVAGNSPADAGLRRPKNTTLRVEKMKSTLQQEFTFSAGLNMFKLHYSTEL